jgi:hypothetical protein
MIKYGDERAAITRIKEMSLPGAVLKIWAGLNQVECPLLLLEKPEDFQGVALSYGVERDDVQRLLPIFGSDTNLWCLDESSQNYVLWNYEDDTIKEVGRTYQQMIASLLRGYVESAFSDDELSCIGEFLEFRHHDLIIKYASGGYRYPEDIQIADVDERYDIARIRMLADITD